MTRRSRLRLRPEPRSANGGIDVAESDISKAAVRGKQSRRRKWLATAVPARARARAGDLSRQFRSRFPPPPPGRAGRRSTGVRPMARAAPAHQECNFPPRLPATDVYLYLPIRYA